MTARNGESGSIIRAICARRDGRSLIQCSDSEDTTAANDAGANGSGALSGSGSTMRPCWGRRLLKGRSSSRWRRVGEESAEVKEEMRVVRGGEERVRARAMLHAFAPRSSTAEKWRSISYGGDWILAENSKAKISPSRRSEEERGGRVVQGDGHKVEPQARRGDNQPCGCWPDRPLRVRAAYTWSRC